MHCKLCAPASLRCMRSMLRDHRSTLYMVCAKQSPQRAALVVIGAVGGSVPRHHLRGHAVGRLLVALPTGNSISSRGIIFRSVLAVAHRAAAN
eukprot:scaffold106713_cov26-Prasinocladus_malaysianus.AAC.1